MRPSLTDSAFSCAPHRGRQPHVPFSSARLSGNRAAIPQRRETEGERVCHLPPSFRFGHALPCTRASCKSLEDLCHDGGRRGARGSALGKSGSEPPGERQGPIACVASRMTPRRGGVCSHSRSQVRASDNDILSFSDREFDGPAAPRRPGRPRSLESGQVWHQTAGKA